MRCFFVAFQERATSLSFFIKNLFENDLSPGTEWNNYVSKNCFENYFLRRISFFFFKFVYGMYSRPPPNPTETSPISSHLIGFFYLKKKEEIYCTKLFANFVTVLLVQSVYNTYCFNLMILLLIFLVFVILL